MGFRETKVYFDGSHYIAIPHTEGKKRYRPKPKEEAITVAEKESSTADNAVEGFLADGSGETGRAEEVMNTETQAVQTIDTPIKTVRNITKKELFDELYKKYIGLKRRESKRVILTEMCPYFDTDEQAKDYIDEGFERKQRNLICRRIRMLRKAHLAEFNYFCTVTYLYGYCFQGGKNFAPYLYSWRFIASKGDFKVIFAPNSVNLHEVRVQSS